MSESDLTPLESADDDEKTVRRTARKRLCICTGTGFAVLGYKKFAVIAYLCGTFAIASIAILAVYASSWALWLLVGLFTVSTCLSATEFLLARRGGLHQPGPRPLYDFFPIVVAAFYAVAAFTVVTAITYIKALNVTSSGMSSTIEKGDRLMYHTTVDPDQLKSGTLVVYKNPVESSWGEPGWLIIARILAVPGDKMSIRDGAYEVNDDKAQKVAVTGKFRTVVDVPSAPETLTIPGDHFFIVQDNLRSSFDSRVLALVHRDDIVGTKVWRRDLKRLLQRVD